VTKATVRAARATRTTEPSTRSRAGGPRHTTGQLRIQLPTGEAEEPPCPRTS